METLIVFGTALALLIAMPILISRMMARARRKRQSGSYGMGFEGAFDVLDPARARALETIRIQQEVGQADEGEAGELFGQEAPNEQTPLRRSVGLSTDC